MHRIFNQVRNLYYLLLILICCYLFSCAYFNTFYNAEISYEKALSIIEESPILDEVEVPEQAKKLLAEAIENSKDILNKYPDSKYVDDAIYIIAKSSFLRDEVAVAESYFNQLLRNYPESTFHSLSEIWLAYTHLRMGMIDTARIEIDSIQAHISKGGENYYLMYNILAEISIFDGDIDNTYLHYEKAAEFAPSRSKKISTYGKLVYFAETNQDKFKASEYLVDLGDVALVALGDIALEKIRIDARMKWITYQRELGNFDGVISEIERLLGLTEFIPEYMQLELELGKVYKAREDIELAKEIFSMIVEKYSRKDETAEAYYQLGFMAIREDFNLDLAREYLESSKSEKPSSFYGRESIELLNKITRYENLLDFYKEAVKNNDENINIQEDNSNYVDDTHNENEMDTNISETNIDKDKKRNFDDLDIEGRFMEMDFGLEIDENTLNSVSTSPDSILFMIGEMLLYDFNHLERSLGKLQTLAEEFPESKYASQALYVLAHFEPDLDWRHKLETKYPNSTFINPDSVITDTSLKAKMEIKRDYAWKLAENSYEESYREFQRLYTEQKDTLSAYISAYISDYYLNDIGRSINHYQTFTDSFPNHNYFSQADNRLKIIKTDLELQKAISQQGIQYKYAIQFFQEEKDFDSVKVLLDVVLQGNNSHFKDAANRLKIVIRNYQELVEEIHMNLSTDEQDSVDQMIAIPVPDIKSNKDSLIYLLAEMFANELEFQDSASYYHNKLVLSYPNSKFRPYSLIALKELEPSGSWENILATDYPDTSIAPDSSLHRLVYHTDIYQDHFVSKQEELIQLCDTYLELFPELIDSSLLFPDTTFIVTDSLEIPYDTISVPVDSIILPMDTTLLRSDTTSNAKPDHNIVTDSLEIPYDTISVPVDSMILPMDTTLLQPDTTSNEKPDNTKDPAP